MNRLLAFLGLVFLVACGISPEDAADELERSAAHPEEWCGWQEPDFQETDKFYNHPDGYGLTSTYGCIYDDGNPWPGGFCWAPASKTLKWRVFNDTPSSWVSEANNEFGVVRDTLNANLWNVTKVSDNTWTYANHIGTTNPDGSGTLGASFQNTWTNKGNITGQGNYWVYQKCEAWLYKTSIEANVFYQAASATEQGKYRKNLWQHEDGHCVGLAHVPEEDVLMSIVYHYPGPMFSSNLNFTSAQVQMLHDFSPFN